MYWFNIVCFYFKSDTAVLLQTIFRPNFEITVQTASQIVLIDLKIFGKYNIFCLTNNFECNQL